MKQSNNITLTTLQQQVGEWSRRNFPNNKPHHPLLGIVEEIAELDAALTLAEETDAIADTMIYLADYCERNELSLEACSQLPDWAEPLNIAIGKLCHAHLKGEQGIRWTPEQVREKKMNAIHSILRTMHELIPDGNLLGVVEITWNKVSKRDWVNKPMTAAEGELK